MTAQNLPTASFDVHRVKRGWTYIEQFTGLDRPDEDIECIETTSADDLSGSVQRHA